MVNDDVDWKRESQGDPGGDRHMSPAPRRTGTAGAVFLAAGTVAGETSPVPVRRPADDPVLERLLAPLAAFYAPEDTVEVRMVRPGAIVVLRRGRGKAECGAPALTLAAIEVVCKALANRHGLAFDPFERAKLSCVLPGGHRFECLSGASVRSELSLAIRCKHPFMPSWADIGAHGPIREYLAAAMAAEKSLIVSGASNTGKTTLLNMLLALLPAERRVIAIEDTPELHIERFWDGVGLLAEREASGRSGLLDWRQLYDHVVRASPDHPVFGEISTQNAYAALAVLNAGMTGFMCSIHAGSARQAIQRKFDQNIAWSGAAMDRVPEYLAELVDVVVHVRRAADGWGRIAEIYEPGSGRYVLSPDGQWDGPGAKP